MNKKFFILTIFFVLIISACSPKKPEPDFTRINSVCELATLKCYYHNVAKAESEAKGLLSIFGVGYKKLWIEYSGIVELGIDVNKVSFEKPNKKGVVKITIPEAEILNIDLDINSISPPLIDKGFMTDVSKEEETETLAEAQENMEATASSNKALLRQAKERAKQILEGYILNVGESIGEKYTVEWVDYK